MIEECETKVANLLASMANLPLDGKIMVLQEIVELQQKQIEDLQEQLDELPEVFELKERMLTAEEIENERT
jgi:hypothetical protein